MTLNKNLINIFEKLINNKKYSFKILNCINQLEKKGLIDKVTELFLIKVTIIISSYYPTKIKFIYTFLKILYISKIEDKFELFKKIRKMNFEYYEEDILDNYHMDKLIFKTFELLYNSSKINNELPITILNEIILNCNKIKIDDKLLRMKLYLMYINKSNNIVCSCFIENTRYNIVYLKVMELCGVTTKIINNFLINK
jgi:hypothetical protein